MHFNDSLMPLCSHNFNSILQVPILKGGLFLLIKAVVCLKISPAGTLWSLFYELVSRLALGLSFDMPEVEQLKIPIINLKEVTKQMQLLSLWCAEKYNLGWPPYRIKYFLNKFSVQSNNLDFT